MNDSPKALFAYADRFSAASGETLTFHVSAEGLTSYEAKLVRLRHGYDGADGPGFRETELASSVDGRYEGAQRPTYAGSYVEIPDVDGVLLGLRSFACEAFVFPTMPEAGRQGVLGTWSDERRAGWAVLIDEGCLHLVTGDGDRSGALSMDAPLETHTWYHVLASHDAATGRTFLSQEPFDSLRNRVLLAGGRAIASSKTGEAGADPGRGDAPFRIGSLSTWMTDTWRPAALYNGKIENPRVYSSPDRRDGTLVAAWDFSRSDRGDGLLLETVLDDSTNQLHGRCINAPTRAVTGHNWSDTCDDFRLAPEQYGAIHFHEDDVEDLDWPADFSFEVPEDTRSGVYAIRLRGDGAEEYVPFFVRPSPSQERRHIALLFPTGSYLAYANDRLPFDTPAAEVLAGHTPVVHPDDLQLQRHYDFGRSCYEVHPDGSGVVLSSRRRPIINMRPRYRAWFMTDAVWQFPADLCIVDWLDAKGYEYDVFTDEDLHRDGADLLAPYEVVLTGSHPEYISTAELDALESYISRGGRLMYLGGNGFYWRVSYHPEKPYLMEVRRSENGSRPHEAWPGEQFHALSGERCGLWRNKGRAPQRLVGVGFAAQGFDRSTYYERNPNSFDSRARFIFEGVGDEDRIGDFGIMGGGAAGAEVDRFDRELGAPPDALLLASSAPLSDNYLRVSEELLETPPGTGGSQDPEVRSDLVFFTLKGGGAVFSIGSIAWTGALSHNGYENNVSRITANVLNRFLSSEPLE